MTNKNRGFTIIELLIVIVIIGILATITIVAYTGIRTKAADSALRLDLSNSAKALANDYSLSPTSQYPTSTATANQGQGLPNSSGSTTYTYVPTTSPAGYSLTGSANGTNNVYVVTNTNTTPTAVILTAPVITTPASAQSYTTDGCGPAPGYYTFWIYSYGTATPAATYQWQRMTPTDTTTGSWINITTGGTSAFLNFNGTGIIADGHYDLFRVIWTNVAGSATSPTVKMTITNGC